MKLFFSLVKFLILVVPAVHAFNGDDKTGNGNDSSDDKDISSVHAFYSDGKTGDGNGSSDDKGLQMTPGGSYPVRALENSVDSDACLRTLVQNAPSSNGFLTTHFEIPFDVKPTEGVIPGFYFYDGRDYLPPGDIYVRSFSFIGVKVDEEFIPFHADSYGDEQHTFFRDGITYTFHHTSIHTHQGRGQLTEMTYLTFHNNFNGIAGPGTRPSKTLYNEGEIEDFPDGGYGIRVRPDSIMPVCMHGINLSQENKTFTAVWVAEYQQIVDNAGSTVLVDRVGLTVKHGTIREADTKPLILSFFRTSLKRATERAAKVNEDWVLTTTIKSNYDANFVGIWFHKHPWNHLIELYNQDGVLVFSWPDTPSVDFIHWMKIPMTTGGALKLVFHGNANIQSDLDTPAAFSFFFNSEDGTDRFEHGDFITYATNTECLSCYNTGE